VLQAEKAGRALDARLQTHRRRAMSGQIESVLQEARLFPAPEAFRKQATISGIEQYEALCAEAAKDYAGFWAAWRVNTWSGTSRSRTCSTNRTHRSSSGSPTAS